MARFCNISAAILIALFITTGVPIAAESVSSTAAANNHNSNSGGQKCGGAAECTAAPPGNDDGEELLMMMDSQTSAWILDSLQATSQNLIYKSLQTGALCNARRAGSCIAKAVNPNLNACKNIRNRSCFNK